MFNPEWGEANGKATCKIFIADMTLSEEEKQKQKGFKYCETCEHRKECPILINKCIGESEECETCPDKLKCPLCLAHCQTCTHKDKCPDCTAD